MWKVIYTLWPKHVLHTHICIYVCNTELNKFVVIDVCIIPSSVMSQRYVRIKIYVMYVDQICRVFTQ